MLGIVLTDFVMLFSIFYYGNVYTASGTVSEYDSVTNKNAEKPFILLYGSEYEITTGNKGTFAVMYALMNAPKMGTFGLKYPIVFAAGFDFPWNLGIAYGIFMLILSIITPIVFGGISCFLHKVTLEFLVISYKETIYECVLFFRFKWKGNAPGGRYCSE